MIIAFETRSAQTCIVAGKKGLTEYLAGDNEPIMPQTVRRARRCDIQKAEEAGHDYR